MSVLTARLDKLAPALSAKERAILVLRSLKDKTDEDPLWRRTMPPDQRAEFRRLIVLMNACNMHLPLFITMVEQFTERLYAKFFWWMTMSCYGSAVWHLGSLIPASKRKQAEKMVAGSFPILELPWDAEEHQHSYLSLAQGMQDSMRQEFLHLWQDVQAIDMVVESVAVEFDGEDPLRPIMRGVVEKTRKHLTALHELLSLEAPLELTAPDEETLEVVRTYFESGRKLMGGI